MSAEARLRELRRKFHFGEHLAAEECAELAADRDRTAAMARAAGLPSLVAAIQVFSASDEQLLQAQQQNRCLR